MKLPTLHAVGTVALLATITMAGCRAHNYDQDADGIGAAGQSAAPLAGSVAHPTSAAGATSPAGGAGGSGGSVAPPATAGTGVPHATMDGGMHDASNPPAIDMDARTPEPSADGGTDGGSTPDDDRCEVAKSDPARPPTALALTGALGTHDPTLIAAHGRYYLYFTGREDVRGLNAKTSMDLLSWRDAPLPLSPNPAWVAQKVPEARNLWAPDISFFNGLYHLYYSASSFGQRTSCIGHATRAALDSGDWEDHGSVICSSNSDQFNAIDPNLVVDEAGTPWLSFGSFWGGLKLIELSADGSRKGDAITSIAYNPAGDHPLEAPVIVRRCGFYYLFVSYDFCCRGANSTYNQRVGRSDKVTGPYLDKAGKPMMEGGGTQLVQSGGSWRGPGHNTVLFDGDKAYNVYHAYRSDNGAPQLRISELVWDADGWPISGGP
jgi:arabinan endo-1,5-alpha-L-arabinosidase